MNLFCVIVPHSKTLSMTGDEKNQTINPQLSGWNFPSTTKGMAWPPPVEFTVDFIVSSFQALL